MDLAEYAPLERALIELACADRDDDADKAREAMTAVAVAWIKLDEREQACKLRYFHAHKPIGATLRAALGVAATKYDLGTAASNYAELKGRPWP